MTYILYDIIHIQHTAGPPSIYTDCCVDLQYLPGGILIKINDATTIFYSNYNFKYVSCDIHEEIETRPNIGM